MIQGAWEVIQQIGDQRLKFPNAIFLFSNSLFDTPDLRFAKFTWPMTKCHATLPIE